MFAIRLLFRVTVACRGRKWTITELRRFLVDRFSITPQRADELLHSLFPEAVK